MNIVLGTINSQEEKEDIIKTLDFCHKFKNIVGRLIECQLPCCSESISEYGRTFYLESEKPSTSHQYTNKYKTQNNTMNPNQCNLNISEFRLCNQAEALSDIDLHKPIQSFSHRDTILTPAGDFDCSSKKTTRRNNFFDTPTENNFNAPSISTIKKKEKIKKEDIQITNFQNHNENEKFVAFILKKSFGYYSDQFDITPEMREILTTTVIKYLYSQFIQYCAKNKSSQIHFSQFNRKAVNQKKLIKELKKCLKILLPEFKTLSSRNDDSSIQKIHDHIDVKILSETLSKIIFTSLVKSFQSSTKTTNRKCSSFPFKFNIEVESSHLFERIIRNNISETPLSEISFKLNERDSYYSNITKPKGNRIEESIEKTLNDTCLLLTDTIQSSTTSNNNNTTKTNPSQIANNNHLNSQNSVVVHNEYSTNLDVPSNSIFA